MFVNKHLAKDALKVRF